IVHAVVPGWAFSSATLGQLLGHGAGGAAMGVTATGSVAAGGGASGRPPAAWGGPRAPRQDQVAAVDREAQVVDGDAQLGTDRHLDGRRRGPGEVRTRPCQDAP